MRSPAKAGRGLFLTLELTLVAVTVVSPVGIYRATGARLSIRPAHAVMRAGHSIIRFSRAQGGTSGHVREPAVTVFHRRGRPPLGVAPATVLITRRPDEGFMPLRDMAYSYATHRLSAWWRAIPAGFTPARPPLAVTASLPASYTTFNLARSSRSHGLPLFASPFGPSVLRMSPSTGALNPSPFTRRAAYRPASTFAVLSPPHPRVL